MTRPGSAPRWRTPTRRFAKPVLGHDHRRPLRRREMLATMNR
jgi:hypothetical protein